MSVSVPALLIVGLLITAALACAAVAASRRRATPGSHPLR